MIFGVTLLMYQPKQKHYPGPDQRCSYRFSVALFSNINYMILGHFDPMKGFMYN